MARVAADLVEECHGRIDAVVVTHPHWDQVSGFLQARSTFMNLKIGEVWLPWTEDPADDLAMAIVPTVRRASAGCGSPAACRANAPCPTKADRPATRCERCSTTPVAAPGGPSRRGPGEPDPSSQPPAASAISVAIRYPWNCQTYPGLGFASSGQAGRWDGRGPHRLGRGGSRPSALRGGQSLGGGLGARRSLPCLQPPLPPPALAGRSDAGLPPRLRHLRRFWRRIDHDWLGAAEGLALGLLREADDLSLALAIEVEPCGRVLLLPGDARAELWGLSPPLSDSRPPPSHTGRPPATDGPVQGPSPRESMGPAGRCSTGTNVFAGSGRTDLGRRGRSPLAGAGTCRLRGPFEQLQRMAREGPSDRWRSPRAGRRCVRGRLRHGFQERCSVDPGGLFVEYEA